MRQRSLKLHAGLVWLVLCPALSADEAAGRRLEFFEKRIRPVLVRECYSCHSVAAGETEGGLALDTRAGIRKGGDRGAAVVPGIARQSLLLNAIRHTDDGLQMPPDKRLPAGVIADFEAWIEMGATDPRDGNAGLVEKYEVDPEKARSHWAFQPPIQTEPPGVQRSAWPKTDVDRFVLAELEAHGLSPVSGADGRTLLRRLTFDLTGLPPTPEEVTRFSGEEPSERFEEAVDRLLASQHFGEKWGRHWLDTRDSQRAQARRSTFTIRTRGAIVTTSSRPSTQTNPMTSSSANNLPVT